MTVADPYETTPVVSTTDPFTTEPQQDTGRAEEAKTQAANVKDSAAAAAGSVAGTAKEQAGAVLSEAGDQAKELAGQAKSELAGQASSAQSRLAGSVRSLADEMSSMASRDSSSNASSGMVTDLVRQGAERAQAIASWLEDREPKDVLDDVSSYARQHPGTFLALAAAAGVVAGRLVRGLKDDSSTDSSGTSDTGARFTSTPAVTSYQTSYEPTPGYTQSETLDPLTDAGTRPTFPA